LRTARTRIEQGRRRAHEIETRQQAIELDGTLFAIDLIQTQTHGDAHEECLRQFDALIFNMQEISVIQGLQTEVVEL
jgi:hypothetical protein